MINGELIDDIRTF